MAVLIGFAFVLLLHFRLVTISTAARRINLHPVVGQLEKKRGEDGEEVEKDK